MKIFGTAQPFVETEEHSFKIGRLVANYEFYKALFLFSDFDEFHLFCPNYFSCELTNSKIQQDNIPEKQKLKIKVFHIASLKDAIKNNNYHVFHLGGWGYFLPGLIYLRNNLSVKPFPITGITHSLNGKEVSFHALKVCMAPVMPFDSIICTSDCGRKVMENLFRSCENQFRPMGIGYNGRMDIIPLGIEDSYRTVPDKEKSRQILGLENDAFVILSLGRLSADRKMDFAPFLSAIKRFREHNKTKKINLLVAGGGDNQEKLLLQKLVRTYGLEGITRLYVNFENDLKTVLYSAADIYAAPIDNLQETFGLSVVEAMAHGCTVVVSDFNGYSELVDHNINGIKIPVIWSDVLKDFEDVSEIMNFTTSQFLISQSIAVDLTKFIEALDDLAASPDKCRALGMAAKEKVKDRYFWSDIIPRYCELWNQLAFIAEHYKSHVEKKKNPWDIDYYTIFSHYTPETLSMDQEIAISSEGQEVFDSGFFPLPYADIGASVILPQLTANALTVLRDKTITVRELVRYFEKTAQLQENTAMYYVLWMMKYNLIKIIN